LDGRSRERDYYSIEAGIPAFIGVVWDGVPYYYRLMSDRLYLIRAAIITVLVCGAMIYIAFFYLAI
jgi:hypothetical protein